MSTRHKVSEYKNAVYFSRVGRVRNVLSKHYAKVTGASLLVLSLIAGTTFAASQQQSSVTAGLETTHDQSSAIQSAVVTLEKATAAEAKDTPQANDIVTSSEAEVHAATSVNGSAEVTINGQSIPVQQNGVTHQTVTNEGSGSTSITVQNTTTTNGSSYNSSTTNVDFYSSSSSDNFTVGGQ